MISAVSDSIAKCARAAERAARNNAGIFDDPEALSLVDRCILGFNAGPPMVSGTYNNNLQIVQSPGYVVIFNEMVHNARIVPTDGRPHGTAPMWTGDSRGHWEGDTLVVETTGFRDGDWLDIWGSPLTDQAKLTERFQRMSYGTLRIDVTIDDPKAYTATFTVRLNQKIVPNGELIEFICAENERSTAHMVGK